MSLTTTRTCKKCKEKINIALENLNSGEFVKYKSAFYHTDCLNLALTLNTVSLIF